MTHMFRRHYMRLVPVTIALLDIAASRKVALGSTWEATISLRPKALAEPADTRAAAIGKAYQ
jgi:hypothetical protein